MIHEVRLPSLTCERLTDVVVLQLWLLFYAASRQTLDQSDCATHLNRCPRFRGRGEQIAKWVWRASESRLKPLQDFALDPAPIADKRKWVKRLACEAFMILRQPMGTLKPFDNKIATSWQQAGADFLIAFYEKVLREAPSPTKKEAGFPAYIFSGVNPASFGAQEFLKEFKEKNKEHLSICPACDESPYSTQVGKITTDTKNGRITADIDHYLPKHRYPHLACHPYNLVPSCLPCNQRIKKGNDPLTCNIPNQGSRRLEDIFMPYRESGLGKQTYLEIELGSKLHSARLGQLQPKQNLDLREKIDAFQETYSIPDRWSGRIDTIDESLFNDLRHFLDAQAASFNEPQIIDWLDYYLHKLLFEDCGKKADSIVMTWLLIAHIDEANLTFNNYSGSKQKLSALLQELELLCGEQDDPMPSPRLSKASVRERIEKARNFRREARLGKTT